MSEVESTTDQTESNEPLWQVQLASGQVCRMTLELLDDAFQDGLITENTLIMQDGTTEWVTLREVAGLDSDAESEAAAAPTASIENPPVAAVVAPVVAAPTQPAAPRQPAPYMDPFAPPIQMAPAAQGVTQMVPPAAGQAAPFVFQGAAQSSALAQRTIAAPPEPLTRSTAPVAADIDFDLDTVNFGKKRSPAKWIIGIAAVLGGLGFAAMNMGASTEIPPAPAAAAPVAAPPAYQPTPAAQPAPVTPAVTKPEPSRLSDEAKRALAEADKTRAAKMQQQRSHSRGGSAAPSGPRKGKDPFHKGGDKYDPLNASL
jgi:hypothetical protein